MQGFHSHRANLGFRHAAEKVDNDHFVFVLCNIAVIKRIAKKIEREFCRAFIFFSQCIISISIGLHCLPKYQGVTSKVRVYHVH